jgi:hypothetical protein
MSRGGSKPGERRGGRQEGTPNKATVQKQLVAAQIAERTVADARTMGKKLAKEVLEDFMLHFADIAEQYRPTPPEAEHQNPHSDEARFNKYAAIAMECARSLAPYQSPTFKAVQIAPAPERGRFIDDAKPVKYPTLAEIRAELAARGLPPLRDILAVESEEDRTSEID